MRLSKKHAIVPAAIIAGVGAGLITAAVAYENGARSSVNGNPAVPLAAHLKGSEEVPGPPDADGRGTALVTANPTTGEVCIELSTTNVAPWTLAHIHGPAELGAVAPPIVDFMVGGAGQTGPELAKCVLSTPVIANAIVDTPNNFYVNVHTAEFPAGAVRGQMVVRTSETQLYPAPVRVIDTRQGTGVKLAVNTTQTVDLQLPVGVRAALITLTVDQTEGGGFLTLYAADETLPLSSTINWTQTGQAVATTTTVAVDRTGKVKVTAGQNGTHFIIDVVGFVL